MSEFDFTATLPAKRMAAGALMLDGQNRILLVKPTYREKWLLPGGIVEAHESPGAACVREVREEIGLEVRLGPLLCLEYRSTAPPKTESLQFIFSCGTLTDSAIGTIQVDGKEIGAFEFFTFEQALEQLEANSRFRLQWALKALKEGRTTYLEDGVCP